MEKRLNRGRLIRKYIGEGLREEGFSYAGYKGDVWEFQRIYKENIIQSIYIYVYRFDPWQITFHLGTNLPGKGIVDAHEIKGTPRDLDMPGYWKYHDENSLVSVLKEMVKIIVGHGMKALESLSIPEKVYDTPKMHKELYMHHKELADRFEKRTGMFATGYDKENVERWFEYIDERMKELKEKDFEEVIDEILEMAAFLGEQIVKYQEGFWNQVKGMGGEYTFINYYHRKYEKVVVSIPVLRLMVGGYLGQSKENMMLMFIQVIE